MRCVLDTSQVDVALLRRQRDHLMNLPLTTILDSEDVEIIDGITNLLDYILDELEGYGGNPGFINKVK